MTKLLLMLSRVGHRILALSGIRAPVELVMRLTHQNSMPAVVTVPTSKNVLVLAPHMDDETIGCGGAIRLHVVNDARVDVVFMTDGARGFLKETIAERSAEELCSIRKDEAVRACKLLGVSGVHYLDLPDGRSNSDQESIQKLLSVISEVKPDLVYLPFITDVHHDHLTTNRIFFEVMKRSPGVASILCACYEVWTPLHPNCIVDISDHIEEKLVALQCYKSQLQLNNYLNSVRGLNAYRAIANHSRGYAEAFYITTAKDYLSLKKYL